MLLECCYDCEGDGLMIVTALQDNYHTHNVLPGDSSDSSNIEYQLFKNRSMGHLLKFRRNKEDDFPV